MKLEKTYRIKGKADSCNVCAMDDGKIVVTTIIAQDVEELREYGEALKEAALRMQQNEEE